jgi:hypothetical protein
MIELTIFKPDGSVYWVEHFNSLGAGETWLSEEQTRPYWNDSYTWAFVDHTQPPGPGGI